MSIRNLHHLLRPTSVAVIGASDRPGSVGATVWENITAGAFNGPLWPVNLRHRQVGGHTAYANVAALPAVPALAVICTPAASVPALIAELGAAGCRAAIVISSGLDAEGADGVPLRAAMLAAARPHLLRILGPNCVGLLVPALGLNASFAPATAVLPGRLAFVAQSGALVTAVLDWAAARRIGFSCFISLGDGSDVDFGDLLDYLAADPHTEAILLYAESVRQARKFMSAARGAARSKPTLIVKAGRSAAAARAAFSHTGALAGTDLVYDAAIRRAGMLRVATTAELFDAVSMLGHPGAPHGERLVILTNGGGPGVMATDALAAAGGVLATLAPATLARLDVVLPPTWSHGNPVDIIGDAPVARYCQALLLLLAAPEVDAVLLIHAPTAIVSSLAIAQALLALLRGSAGSGKVSTRIPVYCCWLGGASVAQARSLWSGAGLPHFETPEAAITGYMQLINYRRNQALLMQVPSASAGPDPQRLRARQLLAALLERAPADGAIGEAETKQLLALYGIAVVATVVAADVAAALVAAHAIGYPVALKLVSPDVSHKSEVGGVALDIEDDAALAAALAAMTLRLRQLRPQARINGFAVQAMIRRGGATELIVGLSTDPVFGPVVLFGQGGVAVEVVADQVIGLPPLNRVLAADMIGRTRVARLLAGFREHAPADLDAICDVLIRLGQLAADLPQVIELDINPLLANAAGAIALDARMRVKRLTAVGAIAPPRGGGGGVASRTGANVAVAPDHVSGRGETAAGGGTAIGSVAEGGVTVGGAVGSGGAIAGLAAGRGAIVGGADKARVEADADGGTTRGSGPGEAGHAEAGVEGGAVSGDAASASVVIGGGSEGGAVTGGIKGGAVTGRIDGGAVTGVIEGGAGRVTVGAGAGVKASASGGAAQIGDADTIGHSAAGVGAGADSGKESAGGIATDGGALSREEPAGGIPIDGSVLGGNGGAPATEGKAGDVDLLYVADSEDDALTFAGLDRLAILPYPRQLERHLLTPIGALTIRPIRPEDAPAHERFFAALSAEDIHMRMFGAMRSLSPAQLARFTQIDYDREMALLATRTAPDGGEDTLGVARVVIDPDNYAGEFAIVVRSDLKGRGLGSLLLDCLLDYCRRRRLQLVHGTTLAGNTAMLALAAAKGFALASEQDGMVTLSLPLSQGTG